MSFRVTLALGLSLSAALAATGCASCEIYRTPSNCSPTDAAPGCPCPTVGACDPVGERCTARVAGAPAWMADPTCIADAGPCEGCACRASDRCDPATGLACECTASTLFGCESWAWTRPPLDAAVCRPDAGSAIDVGLDG